MTDESLCKLRKMLLDLDLAHFTDEAREDEIVDYVAMSLFRQVRRNADVRGECNVVVQELEKVLAALVKSQSETRIAHAEVLRYQELVSGYQAELADALALLECGGLKGHK